MAAGYGFRDKQKAEYLSRLADRRTRSIGKVQGDSPPKQGERRAGRSYLVTPKEIITAVQNQTLNGEFKKIPGNGKAYILRINNSSTCKELILSKDIQEKLGEITVHNLNPMSYYPSVSTDDDITEYTPILRVVEDQWGAYWVDDAVMMRVRGILLAPLEEADDVLENPASSTMAVLKRHTDNNLIDSGRRIVVINRCVGLSVDAFTYCKASWEEFEYEYDGGDCVAAASSNIIGASSISSCIEEEE
jgi:hypothetical protein